MKAGSLLAEGADTCVFHPPVGCKEPGKVFDPANKVSRVVASKSQELEKQHELAKILLNLEKKGNPNISLYFNLAVGSCTPNFVPTDDFADCEVEEIIENKDNLDNLITLVQGKDLVDTIGGIIPDNVFLPQLERLMLAIINVNARGFVHSDAHFNNISWMIRGTDARLVLHDFGRAIVDLAGVEYRINQYLDQTPDERKYSKGFAQNVFVLNYLETLYPKDGTPEERQVGNVHMMMIWDVYSIVGSMVGHNLLDKNRTLGFIDNVDQFIARNPKTNSVSDSLVKLWLFLQVKIPEMFGKAVKFEPLGATDPFLLSALKKPIGGGKKSPTAKPMTPEQLARVRAVLAAIKKGGRRKKTRKNRKRGTRRHR
uniref:Protein kinase domain-containing protein n=1 Tax=viral metagenome TaxID=1070528 RepID=A0A6C0J5H3_9ZZZZ